MSDETPVPGELAIGDHLAGYRLDGIIARGGMAVVYRAFDERLSRSVALKVLAAPLARDDAFRRRFIRESRVAAAVDHPNIVPIFEAGESGGVLFIAMRLVAGRDVLSIIEQHGPLPAARACHIVMQVAAALDAAHVQGLVHRDVKPANMLRDAAGGDDYADHVYLSDFGLSKHGRSVSQLTSHGEFLGTMDYVSPEQIEGRPVDGRSDEYALACSAFEMLSGAPPFKRDETVAIMWAQVSATPPALTSRRPDLPPAVDAVLAKALAKAPDDRYRTCLEFASALRRACGIGSDPAESAPRRDPTQAISLTDLIGVVGAVPPAGAVPPGPEAGDPPHDRTDLIGVVGAVPPAGAVPPGPEAGDPPHDRTDLIGVVGAVPPAGAVPPGPEAGDPPHDRTDLIGVVGAVPPAGAVPPGPEAGDPPHDRTDLIGVVGAVPPAGAVPPGPEAGDPPHDRTDLIGVVGAVPPAGAVPPGPEAGDPPHDRTDLISPVGAMPEPASASAVPPASAAAASGAPPGRPAARAPQGYRMPSGKVPRSRRSRAATLVGCVALLGVIGGGYFIFKGGPGTVAATALTVPGCTTKAATAKTAKAHEHLLTTGGKPFDAVVTANGYGFVSLTTALAVIRATGPAPALIRTIPLGQALGEALTHNQKYLLVTGKSGLTVFSVSDLERGLSAPMGTLTSRGKHAVQVAVSPDGHFAFVTLQSSGRVAVFNLRRALTAGFGPADFVGQIPVGANPIGITTSPDGRYLYVASGLATPASASGQGYLTVIDLHTAETSPAHSVLNKVTAGCGPDRVAVTADGQTVWVSVGGGNAVVAFSAAALVADPGHALRARVAVGQLPLGLAIVNDGLRIIVADSNRDNVRGDAANLGVIDVQRALAGQPALTGVLKSGSTPRQFALEPGGSTLLVVDTGSGQIQADKIAHLP